MNVNPLDLQVLFSKAIDYAATLGKEEAMHEVVQHEVTEQSTKESLNAQEAVQNTEDQDPNLTLINPDKETEQEMSGHKNKKKKGESGQEEEEEKRGLIDENSGHFVDIID